MSAFPRFDFYSSDFLNGIVGLSVEQIAVYTVALVMQYDRGEPIPYPTCECELRVRCGGMSRAKLSATIKSLIELGKLKLENGCLFNARAAQEISKIREKFSKFRENSAMGGKATREKFNKKCNEINDSGGPNGQPSLGPSLGPNHPPITSIDNSSLRSELSAALLSETSPSRSSQVENSKRRVWTGADLDKLALALREAAGCPGSQNPSPALFDLSPILGLIDQGADFESEILPAIRAKPKPDVRSWAWFVPQIQDFRAKRQAARDAPLPDISENRGQVAHRQHKTPMAQNAQPTLEDRQAAEEIGLSIEAFRKEWAKFRDHYLANGLVMADWRAAWRSWLRKSIDFSRAPMRGQPLSTPETGWAILSKRLANYKDMQNERAASAPLLAVIGGDSGDPAEQGLLHSAGCVDERHGKQRVRLLHPANGGAERGGAAAHEQPEDLSPRTPEERAKSESCRNLIQNVLGLSLVASGR